MRKEIPYIKLLFYFLIASLTIILIGSLVWNIRDQYKVAYDYAAIEGDASFNKDLLYRRWASLHGGVYVPVSASTQPNPYLEDLKDRDIESTSGMKLTLMNPAYITRQAFEMEKLQSGVNGHITSLNPLRPENKPDAWERKALLMFKSGTKDFQEIVEYEGEKYLRYMSPLLVEKGCIKCHISQGYKEGDLRGGISVSVPLQKYYKVANQKVKSTLVSHVSVYTVLLVFSMFGYRKVIKEIKATSLMQKKVEESEHRLKIINKETEQANKNLIETNEQLEFAKHKAEESDHLKTAFLQNMSHEIRTPLNAICGFASMLNMPDLDEQSNLNYVSIIQSSADQLLAIVSDVLTISALETKQVCACIEKVNVNTLLKGMYDVFNSRELGDKVKLEVHLPLKDEEAVIDTDRTKIIQVFNNLITNALKFTFEGTIEFGYKKQAVNFLFYVTDTGIGIHPDMKDRVFERFTQDNGAHRKGGNGLGLSISKGFVELLGGNIWVTSELEKGTSFYFTLPIQKN